MKHLIILTALLATPALAQQQSPSEQALSTKLLQEIQSGLNCNVGLIAMQAELTKAQARIKELEAKDKPAEVK